MAKVESRFLVAHSPDGVRAVWVRFTSRHSRSGVISEAWCMAWDSERYVHTQWSAPWAGQWSAKQGETQFALTLAPSLAEFALLPGPRVLGRWPKQRQRTPVPNGLVNGSIRTELGAWSIEGWLGSAGHNTGEHWSNDYVWVQAPFAGGWFEMASSRLHFGPLRTPRLTLAGLHIEGQTYRFQSLRQPRVHLTAQALTMVADNGDGELFAKVFGRAFVALDYIQPNGGSAKVRNDSHADLELRWAPRRGPAREIVVAGGAALEFGGP